MARPLSHQQPGYSTTSRTFSDDDFKFGTMARAIDVLNPPRMCIPSAPVAGRRQDRSIINHQSIEPNMHVEIEIASTALAGKLASLSSRAFELQQCQPAPYLPLAL